MNEQIKELWNKTCGEIQPEMDGICMTNQRGQKFAELVIRECMSYLEDGDIDFAKFMIKKHFGVEE